MNWISVKDGLPEQHPSPFVNYKAVGKGDWFNGLPDMVSDRVLVVCRVKGKLMRDTGYIADGEWRPEIFSGAEVTHWMPFPEPPEE